jgi:hypothetical protein
MDHSCSTFITSYSSAFRAAGLWIASHINPTAQKSRKVAISILIYNNISTFAMSFTMNVVIFCAELIL